MKNDHIRDRVLAEYSTCPDTKKLAAELHISPSKLKGYALRLGIKRTRIERSFEADEVNRKRLAADDCRRIVQSAIDNRTMLEAVWPMVVAA